MKLSMEESDTLTDLMDSVYWPVIEKVLSLGVQVQQERVLSADISHGSREIILARARAEGAQTLASYFGSLKRKVKKNADR